MEETASGIGRLEWWTGGRQIQRDGGDRQREEVVGLRYSAWVWGGGLEPSIM